MKRITFLALCSLFLLTGCGMNQGQEYITTHDGELGSQWVQDDSTDSTTSTNGSDGNSNISWLLTSRNDVGDSVSTCTISEDDYFYNAILRLYYIRIERKLLMKEIVNNPDFNYDIPPFRLVASKTDYDENSIYGFYAAAIKSKSDFENWLFGYMSATAPNEVTGMQNGIQYLKTKQAAFMTNKNSWEKNTYLFNEMRDFLLSFYLDGGFIRFKAINNADKFVHHYEDFDPYKPDKSAIYSDNGIFALASTAKGKIYTIYQNKDGQICVKNGEQEIVDSYNNDEARLKTNDELKAEIDVNSKAREEENEDMSEEEQQSYKKTQSLIDKFTIAKDNIEDVIASVDLDEELLISNGYKNDGNVYTKKVKGKQHKITVIN